MGFLFSKFDQWAIERSSRDPETIRRFEEDAKWQQQMDQQKIDYKRKSELEDEERHIKNAEMWREQTLKQHEAKENFKKRQDAETERQRKIDERNKHEAIEQDEYQRHREKKYFIKKFEHYLTQKRRDEDDSYFGKLMKKNKFKKRQDEENEETNKRLRELYLSEGLINDDQFYNNNEQVTANAAAIAADNPPISYTGNNPVFAQRAALRDRINKIPNSDPLKYKLLSKIDGSIEYSQIDNELTANRYGGKKSKRRLHKKKYKTKRARYSKRLS